MCTRLAAIEARAKALGWDYIRRERLDAPTFPGWANFALLPNGPGEGALHFFMDKHPECAERLLSCYEPGPVVKVKPPTVAEIKGHPYQGGKCPPDCDLNEGGTAPRTMGRCIIGAMLPGCKPGPLCPGAGTFKLTPVEVDDV